MLSVAKLRQNNEHANYSETMFANNFFTHFCSFFKTLSYLCAKYTTNTYEHNMAKAKPFIKWVGGKNQLIEQLDAQLPAEFGNWEDVTYIEPFVGGGAMFFYMLQQYPNIRHAVINDVNSDLTTCYHTVKNTPEELITFLMDLQNAYKQLQTEERRKEFFLAVRNRYNEKNLDPIENTTKFFFLNRTCFNGLYRMNKKGLFNVPFGNFSNDSANISEKKHIFAA